MKQIILAAALAIFAGDATAIGKQYWCDAKSVMWLEDDGTLRKIDADSGWAMYAKYSGLFIDLERAILRFQMIGTPQQWRVIEAGSGHEWVAVDDSGEATAMRIIRVRDMPQPTFFFADVADLATGTCREIK